MGEKGRVERSRVKLAKNNLILGRFYYTEYSTLFLITLPQFKRTIRFYSYEGPRRCWWYHCSDWMDLAVYAFWAAQAKCLLWVSCCPKTELEEKMIEEIVSKLWNCFHAWNVQKEWLRYLSVHTIDFITTKFWKQVHNLLLERQPKVRNNIWKKSL